MTWRIGNGGVMEMSRLRYFEWLLTRSMKSAAPALSHGPMEVSRNLAPRSRYRGISALPHVAPEFRPAASMRRKASFMVSTTSG